VPVISESRDLKFWLENDELRDRKSKMEGVRNERGK
jgi:hypothetical protein